MVVFLLFLHVKQLLMKLLYKSLQTCANQLWVLILANYTPIRYVSSRPPVFIRVEISIHRQVCSHLDKTRPVALKTWSCPLFNEKDYIAQSRDSIEQADRWKRSASVLMVFALIGKLLSKQWATSTNFVHVKKFDRLSLKSIFNVVVKRERLMEWFEDFTKKKLHCRWIVGVWLVETVQIKLKYR